jgi:hypothetical protein
MSFTDFNKYDKHYVILTSDRLIFNAKDDNIFMISKKDIGMSAGETFHINVGPSGKQTQSNYFILNCRNIQFGLPETGTVEHVAKAESTIAFISKLMSVLNNFSNQLAQAQSFGMGVGTVPSVQAAAVYLQSEVQTIVDKYASSTSPIKSDVTSTI